MEWNGVLKLFQKNRQKSTGIFQAFINFVSENLHVFVDKVTYMKQMYNNTLINTIIIIIILVSVFFTYEMYYNTLINTNIIIILISTFWHLRARFNERRSINLSFSGFITKHFPGTY